ncbi:MAG: serine/threonine-protein kinase [Planctomycetota bacterium]|nr:serine/threonine-protein kinase [Planctomycetota bacterium]
MAQNTQDEEVLSDLLLYWEEKSENGITLSPEELCKEYPHLLEPIKKGIKALKASIWNEPPNSENSGPISELFEFLTLQSVIKDRFRIDLILGSGGHGIIYKAWDLQLHRFVAIKCTKKPGPLPQQKKPELLEEARKIGNLKHPGILPLYDILDLYDTFLLVSEFVSEGDLAKATYTQNLTLIQKITILHKITLALHHAHEHSIIHCDLKPSNILLSENLEPKICDFGNALDQNNSSPESTIGSLHFASPEKIQGSPPNISSDIWSFGITLYNLMTGKLPFNADSPQELIQQIMHQPTPSLRLMNPKIPKRLDRILLSCLQKDPAKRYSSAATLALDLESLLNSINKNVHRKKTMLLSLFSFSFIALGLTTYWYTFLLKSPRGMDIVRAKSSRSLTPENLAVLNSQLNLISFWTNPKKNCWSQPREGLFLGDGVGNLSFKEPLPLNFTLQFDLKVINGLRARLILNNNTEDKSERKLLHIGNEGFTRTIGLYGYGKDPLIDKQIPYEINQLLHCKLILKDSSFQLLVDNLEVSAGSFKSLLNSSQKSSLILHLSSGDNFSPGTVEFSNLKIEP